MSHMKSYSAALSFGDGLSSAQRLQAAPLEPEDDADESSPMSVLSSVLRWTAHDFCNDELLADQIQPIPDQFSDQRKWCDHFHPFLLEEIRTELASQAASRFGKVEIYHGCAVEVIRVNGDSVELEIVLDAGCGDRRQARSIGPRALAHFGNGSS